MEKDRACITIYTYEEWRLSVGLESSHFQLSRFTRGCGVHVTSVGDTRPTVEVWSTSLSLTEYCEVWCKVLKVSDRFTSLIG